MTARMFERMQPNNRAKQQRLYSMLFAHPAAVPSRVA